jgi:hypothetical protein
MFEHKEMVFTYEENMGDANNHKKLLEPLAKSKKKLTRKTQTWYVAMLQDQKYQGKVPLEP